MFLNDPKFSLYLLCLLIIYMFIHASRLSVHMHTCTDPSPSCMCTKACIHLIIVHSLVTSYPDNGKVANKYTLDQKRNNAGR